MAELDDKRVLDDVISSLEKQLDTTGLQKAGNGLEFCILRGELPSGVIAIKVPRDRVFSNANDAYIDSRVLLDQEFAIMRHLKACGMTQVPEPISQLEAAGFGALVMPYVPSDGSKPDEYELGQLLAKIHTAQPPDLQLSAQEGCAIPDLLEGRINRRWKELAAFVHDLPSLPQTGTIARALEEIAEVKQLLHMDFRAANLRTKKGRVLAVVDWSNALLGHPALELARVAETGETGKRFLEGYSSIAALPKVSPLAEIIFRLDTAIMLALVFLSEEPNPDRAPLAVKRVRELHSALLKMTSS
jgi:aminoglycoside phosphotransferase (APT) family kinase protein